MPSMDAKPAHLARACSSWSAMSSRSNAPFFILRARLLGFVAVDLLGGLLDQADDVALPRMREAMRSGWKSSSASSFSPVPISLIGAPVTCAHGKRRAAARVAVDAGQHDAGDADALLERARDVDRVLAGHGVGHQQGLDRVGQRVDRRGLVHHGLVHGEPAGGIEDHHVEALQPRRGAARAWRSRRRLARDDRQRVDAGLLGRGWRAAPGRRGAGCPATPSGPSSCPWS